MLMKFYKITANLKRWNWKLWTVYF